MAKPVLSDLDFNSVAKLLNLPTPAAAGDATSKNYVDTAIAAAVNGLAWKDTVRAASTVNITIASPGATLDGVTMVVNDRVLAKDQTTTSENGVYVWNGAAVPMTRAADFDVTSEIEGAVVPVEEGTANAATRWFLTTQNPTIGSALAFSSLSSGAPNASTTVDGLAQLATQAETDSGAASPSNLVVTPAALIAWSGRPLKFSQLIGDGAATQIDVTHNLNSLQVQSQVLRVSDGKHVEVEQTAFSVNVTRYNFASAPALNALRVIIDG